MPIVVEPPGAAPEHRADADGMGIAGRPGALLPRGSRDAHAPTAEAAVGRRGWTADAPPGRLLARDAMWVRRFLLDGRRRPSGWPRPVDGREVERVRDQLRVLHSRRSLSASYAREAFRVAGPAATDGDGAGSAADPAAVGWEPPAPAMIAYALRWLELGDGRRRPPIARFLAEAGQVSARDASSVVRTPR